MADGKIGTMENRAVFDHIAESWDRVYHRTRFRKELEGLAERWRSGRLLNVGCGHGPDFEPFKSGFELHGVDFSAGMLATARRFAEKVGLKVNFVLADARRLPYRDGTFDWAVAVAIYHHIEGAAARLQAFEELRRVLKPGSEAFLTVWNRNQPRFEGRSPDIIVPFHVGVQSFPRYYHLYTFDEFREVLVEAGFTVLRLSPEASFSGHIPERSRNICALVMPANNL
ncbi:MAG: methyltransferase domain-containing protein [Dehalococcoidia bacterium]|nr:methyltransferase domain-containing protein [Dehalococcoidia bacterium]